MARRQRRSARARCFRLRRSHASYEPMPAASKQHAQASAMALSSAVTSEIAAVTTQLRADWRAAAAACALLCLSFYSAPSLLLFLLYSHALLSRRCSHRRPRAARLWRQAAAPLPRRKANRARARSHFVHRLPRAVFRDDSAGRYLGRRDAARSLRGARLPQRRPADARPGE